MRFALRSFGEKRTPTVLCSALVFFSRRKEGTLFAFLVVNYYVDTPDERQNDHFIQTFPPSLLHFSFISVVSRAHKIYSSINFRPYSERSKRERKKDVSTIEIMDSATETTANDVDIIEWITTPSTMVGIAIVLAFFWCIVLEISKKYIYNQLSKQSWWKKHAVKPTIGMMQNFGYPKEPNEQFRLGVTESMARDFYAFLTTLCFQHGISALPMIPVVVYGWNDASIHWKIAFVIGTLSDVGFDIYDSIKSSLRTFVPNHSSPLPVDFWVVIVALHHTLALSLVLPMNTRYIQLEAYHQTVTSLLLAASLCYTAGCYKFTLDVKSSVGFLQYKLIVVFQLLVILYTRLYLWFPAAYSLIKHFKSQNDMLFFGVSCVIGFIFSVFNLLLVVDALGAAVKWLPRTKPIKTEEEEYELARDSTIGTGPSTAFAVVQRIMRRRKFKAVAHSVMAINKMKKLQKIQKMQ